MTLGPAASVSGHAALETSAPHAPALTAVRVLLRPIGDPANEAVAQSVQPDVNGAFTFRNVVPGAYFVDAGLQGPSPRLSDWIVKRVTAGARNLRVEPLQIQAGQQTHDVDVALTDATGELTGRLLDAAGAPSTERYIVLFATDSALWRVGSGHMRAPIRPATDGTFTFTRLPAGRYTSRCSTTSIRNLARPFVPPATRPVGAHAQSERGRAQGPRPAAEVS